MHLSTIKFIFKITFMHNLSYENDYSGNLGTLKYLTY